MRAAAPLLLVAALAASGCVGPHVILRHATPLTSALGSITLMSSGDDPVEAVRVRGALERAAPGARRWGALQKTVVVSIMPDHASLENAVRRRGFSWLRAWGRYSEILIQSPRTWPGTPVSDADLDELLMHELTHCVMFQRTGGPDDWTRRRIPIWFREGMASWTANQGYRRPSLEDLHQDLSTRPPLEVFTDGEALSKTDERFVYGMAHHAFAFLVRRQGQPAIERLLDTMRTGLVFDAAFEQAFGVSEDAFTAEFERYVRWGAFRRAPARN